MKFDNIRQIIFDDLGRLCVYPENEKFNGIWQLAKEVHWDNTGCFLYSPKPREWSYLDWYNHIWSTIKDDFNCELRPTDVTTWINIPSTLKEEIVNFKR